MPAVPDYASILRLWPAARAYFTGAAAIREEELYSFFLQQDLSFSRVKWQAGLAALLRQQLLRPVGHEHFSLSASGPAPVFTPVVAPAWHQLWQALNARLAFRPRCLWSTRWIQPIMPGPEAMLVVEVNWSEVRAAIRIAASLPDFQPVDRPTPAMLTQTTPLPLLVRPWQQRASARLVRLTEGVHTARLEKILVDLPPLVPGFALSRAEWLRVAQRYYPVKLPLMEKYYHYQQGASTSKAAASHF